MGWTATRSWIIIWLRVELYTAWRAPLYTGEGRLEAREGVQTRAPHLEVVALTAEPE